MFLRLVAISLPLLLICFLILGCFQIGKDGEIERLSLETVELHKSKRQLLELVEQKDAEIREKNATIQSYLDKIVSLILFSSMLVLHV